VPKLKRSSSTKGLQGKEKEKDPVDGFEEIVALENSLLALRTMTVEFQVHINWERQVDREILLDKIFE